MTQGGFLPALFGAGDWGTTDCGAALLDATLDGFLGAADWGAALELEAPAPPPDGFLGAADWGMLDDVI